MKKNKKGGAIVRLVIWSIVLLLMTAVLVLGLIGTPFHFSNISFSKRYSFNEIGYNRGGGTVTENVESIEVEWIDGAVTVQTHEGEGILLEETDGLSGDEQLRWKVEDGTLKIFPRKPFWFIGFMSLPEKDLEISLPQGMAPKDLEISTVSGEITLSQFSCGNADLESVSGEVAIVGCDITALQCETVSGALNFNGCLQTLDWESVSGDADLTSAAMLTKIASDTVSGNLTLSMPEGLGFTAHFDSVSGGFDCEFPTVSSHRYGDGSASYQFDTVSGNVTLKKH